MQTARVPQVLLIVLLLLFSASSLRAEDWLPVDNSILQINEPRIDKEADAEILYWKTKIEDRDANTGLVLIRSHYVRIKVFTERGRESQSTIDLLQVGQGSINGLKARTIKPDGSIIPLEKDQVFEREVLKVSGLKIRKFSFSMPAVEVGDIIEYQWVDTMDNVTANYLALDVQRELPTWKLVYQVKPIDFGAYGLRYIMKTRSFQCSTLGWSKVGMGLYQTTYENIPAFKEEAWSPPENQLKAWLLIYYEQPENPEPEKYWKNYGKELYNDYKRDTKPDGKVKDLAQQLTAGLQTDEEKLNALVKFCKTKIKNIYHPLSEISTADLKGFKAATKPSQTLDRGMGSGSDINQLFAALAAASGYDARIARMVGRDSYFFEPSFANAYFMRRDSVAVQVAGKWQFFDLSDAFIEPGMLSWQEEGVQALVSDPKEPQFVQTPLSPAARTKATRRAKFELREDGTLEGVVEVTHTGHTGSLRKYALARKTDAERQEEIKESVTDRFDTAEVSEIEVKNVTDVDKPYTYSYKVSIPGYAQRTGKRLFLAPSYFERNFQPMFRTSERKFPIVFSHGWAEEDEIEIKLPEGYVLDNADAPTPIDMGAVGKHATKLSITQGDGPRSLIVNRDFAFGDNGALVFPVEAYPKLKAVFEAMNQSDNHVITLKADIPGAGGAE